MSNESFPYKVNRSYSTYSISVLMIVGMIILFNFMNTRANTLYLSIAFFLGVLSWLIWKSFYFQDKTEKVTFLEGSLLLPAKVSSTSLEVNVPYGSILSAKVFSGDIRDSRRPGHRGLEIKFERVEGVQEEVFLEKNYLEPEHFDQIVALINKYTTFD